ncbi:MAG: glycosyltransferase [Muribaculaceae bacterium]|nr:glycosyltransferase [Muribaculaceae bacterium]
MITFVVPAYNAERYLRQCVDSILAQSNADLEVVLVDDGSADATGSICDEYAKADTRVRVLHTENRGVSAARNAAVEAARGEWLAFVDADDAVHPQFSERMLRLALDYDCDIAASQMMQSTECVWPKSNPCKIVEYGPDEAIELSLYQRSLNCSVCGKLFKTRLFSDLRFPPYRYEDLDLFHQLCGRAGKIVESSDVLYFYRTNPDSYIHVFTPQRLDVLRVVDNIEVTYAGHTRLLRAARDRKFAANYNMFLLSCKPECWQAVKQLRREVLFNPKSRAKNKAGALLSYLGSRVALTVNKLICKS